MVKLAVLVYWIVCQQHNTNISYLSECTARLDVSKLKILLVSLAVGK